jgi:hypothetical protein
MKANMVIAPRVIIGSSSLLMLMSVACSTDPTIAPTPPYLGGSTVIAGKTGTVSAGAGATAIGTGVIGASGTLAVSGASGIAGSASAGVGGAAAWEDDADGGVAGSAGGSAGVAGAAGAKAAAGSGGASGSAGSAGSASVDGPKPKCKTKASQVILVGDSYINYTAHTFPADMAKEAGETWRMYAVPGTAMATGGIAGLIPPQLDQAIAADKDIVAIVMDGGGNDILIPAITWPGGAQCKESEDAPSMKVCQDIVATAFTAADKLLQKAADAGIRDTLYFYYPHIPGGGLGGAHPNAILDYSLPKAKAFCDDAVNKTKGKLRCHFLDLGPVFDGHITDWFADDGIHENSKGSAQMAKVINQMMKDECIAQPASSGCCEP